MCHVASCMRSSVRFRKRKQIIALLLLPMSLQIQDRELGESQIREKWFTRNQRATLRSSSQNAKPLFYQTRLGSSATISSQTLSLLTLSSRTSLSVKATNLSTSTLTSSNRLSHPSPSRTRLCFITQTSSTRFVNQTLPSPVHPSSTRVPGKLIRSLHSAISASI